MRVTTRIQSRFTLADIFVALMLTGFIYSLSLLVRQWNGSFTPAVEIDLSLTKLPLYTFLSTCRGLASYLISLVFALVFGYLAARISWLEKLLIPLLDILQCIPVLGFLPGLVLGLIALFPNSNFGLELAAILMIFTSQAWNMVFSFYSSLRSVPSEIQEMSRIYKFSFWQRLTRIELPHASVGLAWNSLMSMAGGWFFLTICESFTLGDRVFRLPGLGSYMALAIEAGNIKAIFSGIVAMITVIVSMDFFVWRPLLVWVQKFNTGTQAEGLEAGHSFMLQLFEESALLHGIQSWLKRVEFNRTKQLWNASKQFVESPQVPADSSQLPDFASSEKTVQEYRPKSRALVWTQKVLRVLFFTILAIFSIYAVVLLSKATIQLVDLLKTLSYSFWVILVRDTFWTFLRVFAATLLSTIWTVPVGIYIGLSPRLTRIAQPIVQIVAAFPAPMLYPMVLALLVKLNIDIDYGSVVLMTMGIQWYVLFNVLAGAMGISKDLQDSLDLAGVPTQTRWAKLYLPGIFPSLVVGWITAAGGAWNASIVTEYYRYSQHLYRANGLGATLSHAAEQLNVAALCASILMVVVVVIVLNRLLWHPLTNYAERRFRSD